MAMNDPDPRLKLSEEEVRQILTRAVELESDPYATTFADLERTASEAGISSAALVAAASDVLSHRSKSEVREGSERRRDPFWVRGVPAVLGGAVLGSASRVLEEFVEPNLLIDIPFTVLLISISLILAARVKDRQEQPMTFGQILGIWSGFMAGWAIIAQEVTPDLVFGLGGLGLATAALAAVVMYFALARQQNSLAADAEAGLNEAV